ncbi:helix-turn-helix transcriptional regulator [Hamadaea sp. NPDC051192]|uniref:helix-turn-helix domain-containing protein n=1 Tax=Hamadaea sp. NPDC051192 TaxID=3154940 RepID=UPI00344394D1
MTSKAGNGPGRPEAAIDPQTGPIARFAIELRQLRQSSGGRTYAALARRARVSASALSDAARGARLPTWPVVEAFVAACGPEPAAWRERWLAAQAGLVKSTPSSARAADATDPVALGAQRPTGGDSPYAWQPWPAQQAVDGADPEQAGCGQDATTATAFRVALAGQRVIIGQIQLRHSQHSHAAWSRFEGFHSLDELARRHHVEIEVIVRRESSQDRLAARMDYAFDYHWSDLLRTDQGPITAEVSVYLDDRLVAHQATHACHLA